jgi:hypothetical protein
MCIQLVGQPQGGKGAGDVVGIQVPASEGLALRCVGDIALLGHLRTLMAGHDLLHLDQLQRLLMAIV